MNMSIQYESIGKRIRKFRMEKNLSQEKLAEMINTTNNHISRIEIGQRVPSVETLILIANALNVSVDDLLKNSIDLHNTSTEDEIRETMIDCNEDEQKMLIRILQFMKALLKEFGI